ncbi:type ISP restriction/modification enzyme [Brevundimonas sp.]|uniref:type ISP restriction/modification enzyme n=1 Tax=Brevundimonas sp. TaxID=1871086 RepID=UPI003F70819D
MSQQLINAYLKELATLRRIGGTTEGVTSEAFKDLLKAWARPLGFTFIPQHAFTTTARVNNRVDGAIMLERFPIGYWEAKDEDDDLDVEIEKKFRRGYPKTNIVFEDTHRAVLWQHGKFVMDCSVTDGPELGKLLDIFFGYEREETTNFKKAVAQFKVDLPPVLDILREQIDAAQANVAAFQTAAAAFLKQAKETINPSVTAEDVREMLIQHILTENIFAKVFGDDEFHRKNNVAQALYALEDTFFSGDVRRRTLSKLSTYYAAIESAAALIKSHSEKQGFLKAIYEGFYKVYNAKAADRLGVVYTPNEIVRFMVESADWLCEKHFKKNLIDRDVEILDPATGTGTFIVELLEHFSGQPEKLKHKYAEELHANEVAILPYYVANLNIEATYAALNGGHYVEFPSLCFVDTLDNVAALGVYQNQQYDLLGGISGENVERVKRQNRRKISVVIGNPPYNANQQNENDNNKNRTYPSIDDRIKHSYIKESTAQKTKLYDMYARFFRWASDRIVENGIVAFITNRSFIDAKNFDGFRKVVGRDFAEGWVIDLGGDYKRKDQGGGGNVFGIGTGVAISFWVKRSNAHGRCRVRYVASPPGSGEEKLSWIAQQTIEALRFEDVTPSADGFWFGNPTVDTHGSLPLVSREAKAGKSHPTRKAIFRNYSLGVATNRDDWVYDFSEGRLGEKISFFIETYNSDRVRLGKLGALRKPTDHVSRSIKWTSELEALLSKDRPIRLGAERIRDAAYRPFTSKKTYYDRHVTHRVYQQDEFFPIERHVRNELIVFSDPTSQKPWMCAAVDRLPDLHYVGAGAGAMCAARYRYVGTDRLDNITDWALKQFTDRYGKAAAISKDDIFAYVYAVLHDPVYRETYALNLKREFPRIPLYPDFRRWRDWGQALLDLHIGYETAAPAPLTRTDTPDPKRAPDTTPVVKLKSDPDNGIVVLDADTQLSGIPLKAWRYRLGDRSAIDWVLDQHKEKTPKDPTIREKFNTYRFAEYKEAVVDLLARVVTVSVQTVAMTDTMAALPASAREQKRADA